VVPTSGTPSCAPGPATLVDDPALFPQGGFGPQAPRNGSGAFQVNYQVPTSTPAGTYSVGLRCGGGNVGVFTSLKVTSGQQQGASISVSPSTIPVGGTVIFRGVVPTSGSAACPQSDLAILTDSSLFPQGGIGPQGSRNASGAFQVNYQVPTSVPPGTYSVGVRCAGGNVGVSTSLRVTSQVLVVPSGAPQAGLGGASRGGDATGWIAAGVVAAVLAGLLGGASALRWRRARG
jgi:hypothetical protein